MDDFVKATLVVAGVVTATAIGYELIKRSGFTEKNDRDASETENIFDELVKNQLVCDELDGNILVEWFKKQAENSDEELVFLIARPTEETAKMFAVSPLPDNLDKEHSMFQAAVNKETYVTVAVRMVSFVSLNNGVAELFGNEDYVVVKEG